MESVFYATVEDYTRKRCSVQRLIYKNKEYINHVRRACDSKIQLQVRDTVLLRKKQKGKLQANFGNGKHITGKQGGVGSNVY